MNTITSLARGEKPDNTHQIANGNFESLLNKGINKVNETQQTSSALKDGFARGENISVEDIMLASNEASIYFTAFQTTTQKVIDAYKEVSNMSI